MAQDYREQLENLKTNDVKTAQKAVDYLYNDMLVHMETLLTANIKQWQKRKFRPIYENPTRILIDRSAKTYKEPPKRVVYTGDSVDEGLTETYSELLRGTDLNFISQDLDARARLLTSAILMPQYDDDSETITLSVLSRNNCDLTYNKITRKPESLFYTAGGVGPTGGRMYHHWTPDTITDIEETTGDIKVVHKEPNPYGFIPIAILNDTRPSLGRLWQYSAWEQLIQLSDGVNLFNTESLYNARYASVGSPVTNMDIPDGFVLGIDTPLSAKTGDGTTPFFDFASPTVNIDAFLNWMGKFKEAVSDEWGVNLKFAGGSIADSGFKLVVEEFENIELRQARIVSAKQFEQDLYQVFAGMSEVHQWGLSKDAEVYADFVEPKLPVNKQNEWLIDKEKIQMGIMSIEAYWRKEDPDLTDEEIAIRKRDTATAQGQAGAVPSFDDV